MCENDKIVKGLAKAISDDNEYLTKYLNILCRPFADKLISYLKMEDPEDGQIKVVTEDLDKLTLII